MKTGVVCGVAGLAGMTVLLGQLNADTRDQVPTMTAMDAGEIIDGGSVGPDVTVGDLTGPRYWTQNDVEVAYSIGTTSCNVGDMDLEWIDESGSNRHPVIGQTMYRITGEGRLLQIGQSWLKHGFCALQGTLCGSCDQYCGGCCDHLGPGCSDPYSASRNGGQSGLGPKWEVNPHTGEFPIPWDQGEGTSGEYRRRLRVLVSDVDTSSDPGAQFLMEAQYVTQDDAEWGNQNNNASYRPVNVQQTGTYSVQFSGPTVREQPAIKGWADRVEGVELVDLQIANDGLFHIGSRVVDLGGGEYMYEYTVFNLNSDRAAGCIEIPVADGVTVSDIGFHDVDYHSGEIWDNTDWSAERTAAAVAWGNGTTHDVDPTANAIRWGTAYTMWFTADVAPAEDGVEGTMCLFKDGEKGDPSAVSFVVQGPAASCVESDGDIDENGVVDVNDLLLLLPDWDCTGPCVGDVNCDGVVNVEDLLILLANWD